MPKLPLYICKECEANFTIYSTYYSHIRKHKEPKINCAYCDKKFYVTSEYYKHLGKMHINVIAAAPAAPAAPTPWNLLQQQQPVQHLVKRNRLVSPLFDE